MSNKDFTAIDGFALLAIPFVGLVTTPIWDH